MIIAINTGCLDKDEPGECGNYISEVLERITKSHSEHTFIFFMEESFQSQFIFPANVIPVITGPRKTTLANWFIWYNIKIPLLLRKYKVEVFLTTDLCSLTTRVPQCLVLYDLSFLDFPSYVKKRYLSFYKRYTPKFLKKCKTAITLSEFSKVAAAKAYKLPQTKIDVAYAGVSLSSQPVSPEEGESTKQKYADDNEYFVYAGEINYRSNLINLLKAFSAFKKRQKSNMQLVITSEEKKIPGEFVTNLKSYKFRNEVKLLTNVTGEENAKIIASAYAMIYVPFYENFGTPLLKAMKCEVPVITTLTGVMPEFCGDAALYASPENFKEIAVKMMLLFKDEKLRKELIEKGRKQVQKFNWDNTASQVWSSIEKTMDI